MPYEKQGTGHYKNFGGINSKISPYLNSQLEFLNLENIDFQIPGSLSKRWGSTQYFGASLSGKVNGLYEFNQTSGASYLYAAAGGTLGIALNGGFSAIFSGSTAGSSYFGAIGSSGVDGLSLASLDLDFDTLQNNAFLANGKQFFKSTGGSSFVFFGLPRFQTPQGFATALGSSGVAGGFTGYFYYKLAWINSYGQQGAPTQVTTLQNGLPVISQGATQISISMGTTAGYCIVPPNTDISAIGVFRTSSLPNAGSTLTQKMTSVFNETQFNNFLFVDVDSLPFTLIGTVGVSAGSIAATFIDNNYYGGATFLDNSIMPWNWYPQSRVLVGLTGPIGLGLTYIPRFIETHDNRVFAAGMSYALSQVMFSESGEPENFQPDGNFNVVTNNGEGVSALKSYNGNLTIFKPTSFHSLNTNADDPADWNLSQVSQEYGCLGNRAVATYSDLMVFLDRKGIIKFNGANIQIISTKIDPIFQRMNVSAANGAVMTYDKQRNQILCDIPVDGATMNNLTVVYDIVGEAWSTYKGYNAAVSSVAQGQLSQRQIFIGGYSGLVSYFGSSFLSDNGAGYTCVAKSGFMADLGYSVSKLYRRLFVDSVPFGASSAVKVNFYQDYGASVVFSATYFQDPFQNRIEYGIPAKSLAVEFVMGSTYNFVLNGFDNFYRFLRPF